MTTVVSAKLIDFGNAPTYESVRSYKGSATGLYVGGREHYFDGAGGIFVRTGNAPDNDGTVLVDALGRSWVREINDGLVKVVWFGAKGDGVTDDMAAIQSAINTNPRTIVIEAGKNYLISTVSLVSNIMVTGRGKITSSSPIAFNALAKSNIVFDGLEIQGPGASVVPAVPEDGDLNFGDTNPANGCINVTVKNCYIHGFYTGVSARYGSEAKIYDSEISDFSLYGAILSRNDGFDVSRNYIHGSVVVGSNSYCIMATGDGGASPNQKQCKVIGNRLADAPAWSAFMSHSIQSLLFCNNTVSNVRNGVDITAAAGTGLRNIVVANNYFEGTTTDSWSGTSASNTGIFIATGGTVGTDTVANLSVTGNVISGFGRFTQATQGIGGVLLSNAYNVSVTGNTIIQPDGVGTYVAGIFVASSNTGISISGNVVRSENTKPSIWLLNTKSDSVNISGNTLTHINVASTQAKIRVENSTINGFGVEGNVGQLGKTGYSEVGTNVIDGVSIAAPYGGRGTAKKISQRFQGAAFSGLAAGASFTLGDITIPDAVIGDTVAVGYGGAAAGVIVTGFVSGANTVRVSLYNATGAALTRSAATVSVDVWKHS